MQCSSSEELSRNFKSTQKILKKCALIFWKGLAISENRALIDIRKVLIFESCTLKSEKCALTAIFEKCAKVFEKCTLIFKKDEVMCRKYAV